MRSLCGCVAGLAGGGANFGLAHGIIHLADGVGAGLVAGEAGGFGMFELLVVLLAMPRRTRSDAKFFEVAAGGEWCC